MRAARGTTTNESQMAPCLRHSAICRRYSCFTFRLRRNPHSYRLVGKCPRIRTSKIVRLCVHLPSFHSKLSCRAARGTTTHESQDCSVPTALPQSCPKVFGLSAAYGSPSSYLGVIKCAYARASKLAPAPAHLIAFIVRY